MWPENDTTRLRHVLDASLEAIELTDGRDEGRLEKGRTVSLALVRLLELVGEAA